MVKITRDMSVLFVGVIPIPITTDFKVVNRSYDQNYSFSYEKYDKTDYKKDGSSPATQGATTKANYFEVMQGACSVNLDFEITYNNETQKLLSLLKPVVESVVEYVPSINSVQKILKAEANSYLKKFLTRVSYYDAFGFATFFSYKLSDISIRQDQGQNLVYLSISATKDTSVVEEEPKATGNPDTPPPVIDVRT